MGAATGVMFQGQVGVIGIGNMGLALALNLHGKGWPLRVHDIDPARLALAVRAGLATAATPADLAADCSMLLVVVVDAAQTEQVLFGAQGAAAALLAGSVVLLCPTIAPADVERLATRLAALGLACIDAPMSGGPQRAREGRMSLMVACADLHFDQHQPLLRALANPVFRVGKRPGDGARTKLVNNLLAAVNLAAAAEALALAEQIGLDPARTLAVIGQSSGQSWIGTDRLPRALAGDFEPRAHTTLLAKDSALALAMAGQAGGLRPLLGGMAAALFQDALVRGFGGDDDARMFSLMQAVLQRGAAASADSAAVAQGPGQAPGP